MGGRVLIVAAEFPPVKGIGRLRPLKFCQHLSAHGWEAAVLTVEVGDMAPVDLATLDEIPPGVAVYRARLPKVKAGVVGAIKRLLGRDRGEPGGQPAGAGEAGARLAQGAPGDGAQGLHRAASWLLAGWDRVAREYLLIPDDILLWKGPAVRRGREAVEAFRPDVILATAPYFTDLLVGAALSRATGVPWVADYRDLWTGDVLREWVPPWRRRIELWMERRVVATAAAVVTVSEPKTEVMRARLAGLGHAEFVTLTNGYDLDEFEGVEPEVVDPGPLRIVYAGRLFKNRRGYELIQAAGELLAERPEWRGRLRFEYYGGIAAEIEQRIGELVRGFALQDVFRFHADVPYARSKALQMGADALLLIVDAGETSSGVIPGKLFEYVAAGQPILCIASPGATTEIIDRGRLGRTAAPGDVAALKAILADWAEAGTASLAPDRAYLAQFERGALVARLAGVLERVSARGESAAQQVDVGGVR